VVLTTPNSRNEALDVVRQFFKAVFREDAGRLGQLLLPHANLVGSSGTRSSNQVQEDWSRRFRLFDYTQAQGELVYQESQVASYSAQELARIEPRRFVHLPLREGDLLFVIPIAESRPAQRQKFGSVIELLLTPTEDGFKIRSIYEDFRMP
jgi:hypothetical protein